MSDTPETIQAIRRASVKTSVYGHMDTDCVYAKDMVAMERERNALADALRVRIKQAEYDIPCMVCGFLNRHIETCRHYETEKKLIQQG